MNVDGILQHKNLVRFWVDTVDRGGEEARTVLCAKRKDGGRIAIDLPESDDPAKWMLEFLDEDTGGADEHPERFDVWSKADMRKIVSDYRATGKAFCPSEASV